MKKYLLKNNNIKTLDITGIYPIEIDEEYYLSIPKNIKTLIIPFDTGQAIIPFIYNMNEEMEIIMGNNETNLLYWACCNNFKELVTYLLKRKKYVQCVNKKNLLLYGNTPLYICCSNMYYDLIKLLLENSADPNIKNNQGLNFFLNIIFFNIILLKK